MEEQELKLFHIFNSLTKIKKRGYHEFYEYDKISVKIFSDKEATYISIFDKNVFRFAFLFCNDSKKYAFRTSKVGTNIVIDSNDFNEDEDYLILAYGKEVSSKQILKELGITIMYLDRIINESILQYNIQ